MKTFIYLPQYKIFDKALQMRQKALKVPLYSGYHNLTNSIQRVFIVKASRYGLSPGRK